jgi:hypothetical protein
MQGRSRLSRTVVQCGVSPRPEGEWGAVCRSASGHAGPLAAVDGTLVDTQACRAARGCGRRAAPGPGRRAGSAPPTNRPLRFAPGLPSVAGHGCFLPCGMLAPSRVQARTSCSSVTSASLRLARLSELCDKFDSWVALVYPSLVTCRRHQPYSASYTSNWRSRFSTSSGKRKLYPTAMASSPRAMGSESRSSSTSAA